MNTREEDIARSVRGYPAAVWWKRLPIIRHIRAIWATKQINAHYEFYLRLGQLPVNSDFDYAVRDAIWRGEK